MKKTLNRVIQMACLCFFVMQGCQPDVDEITIESCLLSKVDNLNIQAVEGGNVATSSSTVFEYDSKNRPVTFSYYSGSQLTGFTEVDYNSDGTLKSGETFDALGESTGTVEYDFNSDDQITNQRFFDEDGLITQFYTYDYNSKDLLREKYDVSVNYTTFYWTGFIFRYEYDDQNNVKTRHSKYLRRLFDSDDPNFATNFLADLEDSEEFLNVTRSEYDDQFNPYRSQLTLGILFDDFPSFNNATEEVWRFVDSGIKYADISYSYQYNRKGFPYIYTQKVNYTADFTSDRGITDYTTTSSYEYECD